MAGLVVSGDYKHSIVSISKETGRLALQVSKDNVELSKENIEKYEIIHIEYKKSIIDIISRVAIGLYFMGFIGIIAGFTASNTYEAYRLIDIEFKNGKKSLIKINKKQFKQLIEII